ncbi:carbohydrate-binding domain-containing protein [Georgenia phoenicis]|uniref:carbohydrate-binding domain-containing protein n=1 Tax=unclassified Georgenia TaxID=2626815 RepID=UPI0039B10BF7
MRTITRSLASLLLLGGLVAGCSAGTGSASDAAPEQVVSSEDTGAATAAASTVGAASVEEALGANLPAHETETEWDTAAEVAIDLADGATEVSGEGAVVDGDTVTITQPGTYRLSGTVSDGEVIVSSALDGVVRLVLDGVDITSSTTAPIAIEDADEAVIVLAEDSTNALADTARTVAEDADEPDGALFSRTDLTITGTGSLTVTGHVNDGIAANDGLVIDSGTLTVDAVDDGIRGKDYLLVTGGDVTVTAGGDGLKSDEEEDVTAGYVAVLGGTVTVDAGADGLDAATDVIVGGGTLDITTGGGEVLAEDASAKGLKANVAVVVGGGTTVVDAADDAVHSDGAITVTAGELSLASGDDGVHAEESLVVTGGTLAVVDSYEGLEAESITIAGGDVSLVATDDGVNAAGGGTTTTDVPMDPAQETSGQYALTVTGGTLAIDAGGDGVDSNGTVDMSGGTVVVSGPIENGNGALDVQGTFTIDGGVLFAAGSSGMAMAPGTDSPQASILATFDRQPVGTVVTVATADGEVVASFTATKELSSVVLSSSEIIAGETYEVYVGGTVASTPTAGLYDNGDLTGASVVASVTGGEYAAGGMFGGGGMPGGPGGMPGGDFREPPQAPAGGFGAPTEDTDSNAADASSV